MASSDRFVVATSVPPSQCNDKLNRREAAEANNFCATVIRKPLAHSQRSM